MRYVALLTYWLIYFSLHSALASLEVKQAVRKNWPSFMPFYRIAFNLLAVLFLIPALWLLYFNEWPVLWRHAGFWKYFCYFLQSLALAGFLYSLKYYDMREFLGFRESDGAFTISPLHRFVRHPWYFLALVIVWTSDMDTGRLLTAISVTLYFIVGSKLEEEKLVALYGESYSRYRKQVPRLFPLPWQYWHDGC